MQFRSQMFRFIGVLLFVLPSHQALSGSRICGRNFSSDQFDLCKAGSPKHRYVVPEDRGSQKVCVMTYDDDRCKFSKNDFAHAKTQDGQIVCTLNYNQPGITGNFCALQPEFYAYILDPWL